MATTKKIEQLKKLHKQLIKLHQRLASRLTKAKNPGEAEAILREMEEVNFRVMMAGRLLFKAVTAKLDGQIGTVVAAGVALEKSIKEIKDIKKLVVAVGKFLSLVDKVLDAVKLL